MSHWVLSNVKAKKVETWLAILGLQRMRDPRFTGLQREAQRAEPLGDEVLTVLYNGGVLMEDHQVVSVDYDIGRRAVLAVSVWEGLRDGRFEAMEGNVGQQG
jgi:hypothetical protein